MFQIICDFCLDFLPEYANFCYSFAVNALRPSQQYFSRAMTFVRVETVLVVNILLREQHRDKYGIPACDLSVM